MGFFGGFVTYRAENSLKCFLKVISTHTALTPLAISNSRMSGVRVPLEWGEPRPGCLGGVCVRCLTASPGPRPVQHVFHTLIKPSNTLGRVSQPPPRSCRISPVPPSSLPSPRFPVTAHFLLHKFQPSSPVVIFQLAIPLPRSIFLCPLFFLIK